MSIITLTKHKAAHNSPPALQGVGAPAIKITPEMIEAGVYEAREHTLGEPLDDLVRKVYLAMALELDSKTDSPLPPPGT
jgi:hypothetical protein